MVVLHIITGLNDGGAEGVLYRLCHFDVSTRHVVVSLMGQGKYGSLLKKDGVEVICLDMEAGKISLSALWLLFRQLRTIKPDVVQTWMYHADLLGGVISRLAGIKSVFWNIRQSAFDASESKNTTILVAKVCALLSGFIPKGIICCGHDVARFHSEFGYKTSRITVVSNGYDLNSFCVNDLKRCEFRQELMVDPEKILLGMVGRFHPQKDYFGLLKALSIVKSSISDFKIALVGFDLINSNKSLKNEVKNLGLEENIFLLGQRTDIPVVMNGIDIKVLSSAFGEGFPNVIAEAMACGTPCVATDVGDTAVIVAGTGWVVPAKDPQLLAKGILDAVQEMLTNNEAWSARKVACSYRIKNHFGMESFIRSYHLVWGQ
jgi:glycosyltransferase involved in cell wall biosynthesis